MKLTIERSALLVSLQHIQSVVERRNTIPILSNVQLTANGSELGLTATDMDIWVYDKTPAEISQNGTATAPAHMLFDIVRKLPDGSQVELDTSDGDEYNQGPEGLISFTISHYGGREKHTQEECKLNGNTEQTASQVSGHSLNQGP